MMLRDAQGGGGGVGGGGQVHINLTLSHEV